MWFLPSSSVADKLNEPLIFNVLCGSILHEYCTSFETGLLFGFIVISKYSFPDSWHSKSTAETEYVVVFVVFVPMLLSI